MYSCKKAFESLLGNRTRYHAYAATLNDRASSPDELVRSIFYYFNQATLLKNKAKIPLPGQALVKSPPEY